VTCDGLASRPGGVEILLAASCYGNRDKLRQHAPVLASRLHFFSHREMENEEEEEEEEEEEDEASVEWRVESRGEGSRAEKRRTTSYCFQKNLKTEFSCYYI